MGNITDDLKMKMFYAACILLLFLLGYCFVCVWIKPIIDLTTPILNLIMLLLGYYWGTSKSSSDKSAALSSEPLPYTASIVAKEATVKEVTNDKVG
jgi:hypothetical protein